MWICFIVYFDLLYLACTEWVQIWRFSEDPGITAVSQSSIPANIYLFNVNNRNTRKRCELSLLLNLNITHIFFLRLCCSLWAWICLLGLQLQNELVESLNKLVKKIKSICLKFKAFFNLNISYVTKLIGWMPVN